MIYLILIFLTNQIPINNCAIPTSLHNYIKSSKRLEKYSITLLLNYDNNSTDKYIEEKLYLKNENVFNLNNTFLEDKELSIALCQKEYDVDCRLENSGDNSKSYSISVLKILQKILKFRTKYNVMVYKTEEIEYLDDYILTNSTIDLILCHPNINNSLYEVLYPTVKTSYVIVYKPSKLAFNQDIFVLTFAGTLWLCFIVIIIVLAICLNISTKQYSLIYGHPSWGTVDITFWAIAAACQQGLSSTPNGFSSRLIFFVGYLTAYLLYTGFAAGVTSLLAVQNQNYILEISDIEKMQFKVTSFGNIQYLPTQYNYLRNAQSFKTLDAFLSQLNKKKWIGITTKLVMDQYFASQDKNMGQCLFIMSELKHSEMAMSFLVAKNSQYKKYFNYWLLRLDQTGILNLTAENTKPNVPSCVPPSGYSSASLHHVGSAIMVLVTGIITSLVFLLIECIWNGYKHRVTRRRQT